MRREGTVSSSFAHVASLERPGRVEPELGPSMAPRTSYPSVSSDAPAAPRLLGAGSDLDSEPRLFDVAPGETPLPSAPAHPAPADRPHFNSAFLLLVGLIIAAIIGVYFGLSFSLLKQPKDRIVVAAGPVSSGVEEAKGSAKVATSPDDSPPTVVPFAEPAPAPEARSHEPELPAPPPQVSSHPDAAKVVTRPGESIRSASGGSRSRAHSATRRGASTQPNPQPALQTEKQRILSAAMDRAHRENLSDSSGSLTPPHAGARNPFDQLITQLTGQTKPARPLTPP
jgi:hypothetical protein